MTKKINRKPGEYLIREELQLEALKSPARQEIVDALNVTGSATVAGLSQLLARAPDSLYLHIKELLRVGLLVEEPPRKDGRHVAAVFSLPGQPVKIDYAALGRSPVLYKVIDNAVRTSIRDLQRALQDPEVELVSPSRVARGGRVKGWLDSRQIEELNSLVSRIEQLLMSGEPGPGRQPCSFGFVLAPAGNKRVNEAQQKKR